MGASPYPAPNSEEKRQDRVTTSIPPQEAARPGSAPGPLGPVCRRDPSPWLLGTMDAALMGTTAESKASGLPESWWLCFRYTGSNLKAPVRSVLFFTLF